MGKVHQITGFLFLAVFLATGLYMGFTFPEAWGEDAGTRMIFRSAHVYILFSALLNLALAISSRSRRWNRPRKMASFLLLVAPVLFTAAFFIESAAGSMERPYTLAGAVACLIGVLVHQLPFRDMKTRGVP
ncbi:MAG: hypothetical protein K0U98_24325 [Deltaproteobacteria bacterium]|nr:hypothetical protein [Deltaproteobacteria bacterium]